MFRLGHGQDRAGLGWQVEHREVESVMAMRIRAVEWAKITCGIVLLVCAAATAEASHMVQTSGPVSARIVEDVWETPEYCYPCLVEGTDLFGRTFRIETSEGADYRPGHYDHRRPEPDERRV